MRRPDADVCADDRPQTAAFVVVEEDVVGAFTWSAHRIDVWHAQLAYATSFVPRALRALHACGVEHVAHALYLFEDALTSGIRLCPPSSPVYVHDGARHGGVGVHLTTESLMRAASFGALTPTALDEAFALIQRFQHLAVVMALVELGTTVYRAATPNDDPNHLSLPPDERALVEPALRFVAAVLQAEPHGDTRRKLRFVVGAPFVDAAADGAVLSLQVAFEPTPALAPTAGYDAFVRLLANGVRSVSDEPFYTLDAIRHRMMWRDASPTRMHAADA